MLALMSGPVAAFAFFLIAVGGGELLRHEFSAWNLQMLERLAVIGGLYKLTIVPPFSYLFCRNIFSRQYWHFPRNSWKWICALALVQLVTLAVLPPQAAFSRLLAFNAIVISPLTEEIMRAVMIFRIIERWGPFWGIAVTTTLFFPDSQIAASSRFGDARAIVNARLHQQVDRRHCCRSLGNQRGYPVCGWLGTLRRRV